MGDRVKTGVHGLDELMEGGIPRNHAVLLSGQAGSGKTLLGLQFLAAGASQYGEKGCFITFEQRPEDVISHGKSFGWDLESLVGKGEISILSYFATKKHASTILDEISAHMAAEKPDRVVLDSLSTFAFNLDLMTSLEMLEMMKIDSKDASFLPSSEAVTRRTVVDIVSRFKDAGVTSLLISEIPEGSESLSRDNVSEYVADGVITMRYLPHSGEAFSNLQVRKMRGTSHMRERFGVQVRKGAGIVVKSGSL